HLALGRIVAAQLRVIVDDALVAPGELLPGPEAARGRGVPGAAVVAAPSVRAAVGHRLLDGRAHVPEVVRKVPRPEARPRRGHAARMTPGGAVFEAPELGRKVSKSEYATQLPDLRSGLLGAQVALRPAGVPVILVFSGADGAGKSETVQRLHEWLDPRGLETNAFGPPSDEERERPAAWRFWRTLPARGRIGMYLSSWYTDPLVKRAYGKLRGAELDGELNRIAFFEQMLVDDGAL